MSISALGLLNVLLLVPFMVYLALLTAGYAVSVGLTIAGVVGVIALSGHHFFGKTARDALPFSFSTSSSEQSKAAPGAASDAKDADSNSDDDTPGNLKSLKIVGDRFVFNLQDDLVTNTDP